MSPPFTDETPVCTTNVPGPTGQRSPPSTRFVLSRPLSHEANALSSPPSRPHRVEGRRPSSAERHAGRFLLALDETGPGGRDAGRRVHLVGAHGGPGTGVRGDYLDVAALLAEGLDLAGPVGAGKSAQALELAGPVLGAERREHHDVRKARGQVGVFGGAHATVDVASAVDVVRGGQTGQG